MNTELIVWLDRRFDKIEQKLSVLTEQLSSLQPIPPNRLVDIKGAAVITRFKPSYIYGLVHQKKIPHVKFGHSVRSPRTRCVDASGAPGNREIRIKEIAGNGTNEIRGLKIIDLPLRQPLILSFITINSLDLYFEFNHCCI
ncbi:MAG: hypothetical protein ACLVC6_08830 [Alistipes ihumii]|jgi:hypothetical protein|uniref:hypothetical protein n=2 Tax=Alistipes ihumii TaxID=1470347 RepID=UPI002596E175|nr:hypothetical protein [Alistipes ihumii]